MDEKIVTDKLIECFESIKSNILIGFSGFIELNNNGLVNELEKDISFANEKINYIINSQYIEVFDMISCELYFENESHTYLNGAEKGSIVIPLSAIIKFSRLYIGNNYDTNLMEIKKLTSWILKEINKKDATLESIYISDRLDEGEVEYISYEINFK
jgi:hypothetical protein